MGELFQWVVFLITIVVLARVAVLMSNRFALPPIALQLLIGVFLGPSLVDILRVPMVFGTWGNISPNFLHSVLKILAEIGLIQLMFLSGLQVDWRQLKNSFKIIFSVSGWSFVLAAASVAIVARCFVDRWGEALGFSAIMASSGFGVIVHNFSQLKFPGNPAKGIVPGIVALNGALAILLMIVSLATNYSALYGMVKMAIAVSWFMGKLIMFFSISYFLISRFLNRVAKTHFQERPRQMLIGYLLLMASLYAWGALHFGSFAAVGIASLGGALLGMSDFGLKERMAGGFQSIMASLPIGVLFVVLGMEVNFKEPGLEKIFLVILFGVVAGTKLIGSWMATRRKFDLPYERSLIMIGVLPQGEMGMLIAAYLFSRGLINPSQFNISIIAVVMLTMLSPILMRIASYSSSPFDGRRRG